MAALLALLGLVLASAPALGNPDHSAGDYFIFAKAAGDGATSDRKANEADCDSSNDKQADVSGSNTHFYGRMHSNADLAISGSGNTFHDTASSPNSELTYGVNDGGGAPCQLQADAGNTYSSGAPLNITGNGNPADVHGPYQIGPKGWPGNLGDYLNADGMTFGNVITQVLPGEACDAGSLTGTSTINVTSANDGQVICNGTGEIKISVSNLGTAADPFEITMISHGLIEVSGSNHHLAPAEHGVLAWTDQRFSSNATSFKLAGSNVNVASRAIAFTPRSGQDVSGSNNATLCLQLIGQGSLKVAGSNSTFGPLREGCQAPGGTTLTASKTAAIDYTRTFEWTIDKSVSPDSWDLFKGDSGTSRYTIEVTKDEGTVAASISGRICVTNGGAVATENLKIVDNLSVNPSSTVIASTNVDVSSNPVLDPGEEGCYPYEIELTGAQIQPDKTYKNTANVTITNHSGHLGSEFGPSPTASAVMPANPTEFNDTINVDDSDGSSWEFSDDGSRSYNQKFSCDEDEGKHDNTATIRGTEQSDSATVTVNCYALDVTKTAEMSLDRTYGWKIDKSADQSALNLAVGQTFSVNYEVVVDLTGTPTDSNHHVNGDISVENPAPVDATINDVTDLVSGPVTAVVDCGVTTFPYTLAAGQTLECTYDADLPNANSRTNTATAKLQNYDYASDETATKSGVTDFTGSASVNFSNATVNEIDECVDVSDTYAGGPQATVCADDPPPVTFKYSRNIGPYQTCGNYTVTNTAAFTTKDTGATGSDSANVAVRVPCGSGCTLTQGYWKTHSDRGPAPYDDTWALLGPNGEDTAFFLSGKTWYQVFWTPPAGNPYYNLAHQYEAAVLNQLNGASVPPAVQTAITQATTLFNTYTPATKFSKAVKTQMLALASILAAYNEGYTGPGHCSEDGSSSKSA